MRIETFGKQGGDFRDRRGTWPGPACGSRCGGRETTGEAQPAGSKRWPGTQGHGKPRREGDSNERTVRPCPLQPAEDQRFQRALL